MIKKTIFLLSLFILVFSLSAEMTESPVTPAYLIPVNEDIDPFLVVYLKRSIIKAREAGAGHIIFQLNTFGGRVDSALEITALIGSVSWAETVAYIPSSMGGTGVSWSAGALISFSCDSIYMDAGTSMGAAAPVYQSAEGMEMAEEKVVSAVRGHMAALAEKNGYSRNIALAMVDDDMELYEVESEGRILLMTPDELESLDKEDSDSVVKGLQVTAPDKLLTLTAGDMERYGVSSATVSGIDSLLEEMNLTESMVVVLEKSRSDWLVAFLSSAAVSGLLVMLGLVALYMEVTSPGFGIPGTVALICFAIVFSASTLIGNMGSLEMLLFLAGVVFLLIELFIIPGFGITGISGIILILLSLVLARQDFVIPEFGWQWDMFRRNLLFVSASLMASLAIILILVAALPKSRLFGRLVLSSVPSPQESPGGTVDKGKEGILQIEKGSQGLALTDLRPVGKGEFGDSVLVVQTDGEYIEKGAVLTVVSQEGLRLVVRRS